MARHGSPAIVAVTADGQPDPFRFAGTMWVGRDLQTPAQRYYPKYPPGAPAAYAVAYRLGGDDQGLNAAYWVSPAAMALALFLCFLLFRRFAGSLPAFLALVVLATTPLTLGLANSPASHALALLFSTAGMLAALLWWHGAGLWAAIATGLLIGLATSVRYTEALLILPASLAAAYRLHRHHDRRALIAAGSMLATFFIVVFCVLILNHHHWIGAFTGYSATRENTLGLAFRLEHLLTNLPAMLRQLHDSALAYILPFALLGIVFLFRSNWRLATIILAWMVPSILVYSLYYWAPQREGTSVGYLRFILSTLPAMLLCAAWLCAHARASAASKPLTTIAAGILVAAAMLAGLSGGLRLMRADHRHRLLLADNASHIMRICNNLPADAAIFCSERGLLNHLQAALPQEAFYDAGLFEAGRVLLLIDDPDTGKPEGPDPNRRLAFRNWLTTTFQQQTGQSLDAIPRSQRHEFVQRFLDDQKRSRVAALLASGRRVLFIQSSRSPQAPAPLDSQSFQFHTLVAWRPYILAPEDAAPDMDGDWLPTWRVIEARPLSPPVAAPPPASTPGTRPGAHPATSPATRPASPERSL